MSKAAPSPLAAATARASSAEKRSSGQPITASARDARARARLGGGSVRLARITCTPGGTCSTASRHSASSTGVPAASCTLSNTTAQGRGRPSYSAANQRRAKPSKSARHSGVSSGRWAPRYSPDCAAAAASSQNSVAGSASPRSTWYHSVGTSRAAT